MTFSHVGTLSGTLGLVSAEPTLCKGTWQTRICSEKVLEKTEVFENDTMSEFVERTDSVWAEQKSRMRDANSF